MVMSASGQGVPGRLNISPSAPMQNIDMASAISRNRLRRLSGMPASIPASRKASRTSSGSTMRRSVAHFFAASRMHWRMALRSARVSR
ncbi:hypothetical protein D3C84_661720 [compost metagenome]